MKYKKDMDFLKLRAGTTVQSVPLDHPVFWTALNRPRNKIWLKRADEITDFLPVYFCKNCRQIEDGAHRILALHRRDGKNAVCDIKIYSKCIHRNSGYWGLLEASLKEIEDKGARLHRLDYRWLRACAKDKWPIIRKVVNFKNKTVLDIGCHCGYSVLEAIRYGAKSAKGIDIRKELIKAGAKAITILGLHESVLLTECDWESYKPEKTDIVMSLGLLHYFPLLEYETLFTKLLDTAKETVIIELRTYESNIKELTHRGNVTKPSSAWLYDKFGEKGFKVIERYVRKPERELWIAERK